MKCSDTLYCFGKGFVNLFHLVKNDSISKTGFSPAYSYLKIYRKLDNLGIDTCMHMCVCSHCVFTLGTYLCVHVYAGTHTTLSNVLMFYFFTVSTSHHFFPPRTVYPHSRHDCWKGGRKNKRLVCLGAVYIPFNSLRPGLCLDFQPVCPGAQLLCFLLEN